MKAALAFRPATDADRDAWQTFLEQQGSGDFLHDWAWAAVAELDGQPQRRFLLTEDGERAAFLTDYERELDRAYPRRGFGVLFPFTRLFAVGRKTDAAAEKMTEESAEIAS